ncbi:Na+/H+ antiporter subunit E [Halostella sp. JP-L12]|uniref:Na+/H+ antiporter subunit E n=1 Tax=Halostella TaxID=1843185 RepID=UPI000EF7FA3A|nr:MULTISPECIES: Na+/H+ antiporter subunit E [Halostella]NHN47213.1 Na+/H+ antiporter subunit E [Halostella sp. JP-L12]
MTRRWPVVGAAFAALWVFVRGVEFAPDAVLGQFLLGLVVGMPVAFVFRRLYAAEIDLGGSLRSIPAAAAFGAVFLREIVVANVDVAYRVLAPGTQIDPEVILVPLRVETDVGVTTIANSITITPGTITLDHDPEANALYVHVIDGRDPEAIVEPIRAWEDYALVIFDEERSPDDPAPDIAVYPAGYQNPPDPLERGERAERAEATEQRDGSDGGDADGR